METINRQTVNEQQYSAPEFPKSGFNLSYKKYMSWQLGKLHASGYQWTMPGDKIYGNNKGNGTFNRIVTPMVTPIDVGQYNFYMPLRGLDRTFERGIVPTKLNAMSANWSAPTFNLHDVYEHLFDVIQDDLSDDEFNFFSDIFLNLYQHYQTVQSGSDSPTPIKTLAQILDDGSFGGTYEEFMLGGDDVYGLIPRIEYAIRDHLNWKKMYLLDACEDYIENIKVAFLGTDGTLISSSTQVDIFMYNFLDRYISPILGRYSYLAELGYQFLTPFDIYRLVYTPKDDTIFGINSISTLALNEYPIRAMYVIWYERFRDVNLEPVSANLPDWHDFGSDSIVSVNPLYLIYRFRSWYKDMFVSAQIDDLSRHVYAPIVAGATGNAAGYHMQNQNNNDSQFVPSGPPYPSSPAQPAGFTKPSTIRLGYIDENLNSQSVYCPIPTNVNDVLSALDTTFQSVYGLDLNTLRQSQQLEKYLKRNYLFGDEYADRMLAHYNSRVSDMRINKPALLSSSLNNSSMSQQISNVSTEETKVGERTATAGVEFGGDDYSTFCEEFGIIINLISFMPRATYNGLCPQLLISKQVDFPLPEFATNNEEFGRKIEIAQSALAVTGDKNLFMFGRYPAYHAWRSRVDEVGGMFLNELQDCTFRRFWGMHDDNTIPKLNYQFIHCRPQLSMFANTIRYDSQIYGDVVHECFVERVLPTPAEVI